MTTPVDQSSYVLRTESGNVIMTESPPDAGGGMRHQNAEVTFKKPFFDDKYEVMLSLVTLDTDNGPLRFTTAVGKTPRGMTIQMSTWANTNLISANFQWLAIGR